MIYDDLLGICIATCYPERVFDNIFSHESLSELEKISDSSILLVNLQRFSTSENAEVVQRLNRHHLHYIVQTNDYHCQPPNIPINKIRNDCAIVDCFAYLILDDDMNLFDGAAFEFLAGVHYLATHDRCGIISYRTKPSRVPIVVPSTEKRVIAPMPWNARYNTANGLLCRNIDIDTHKGRLFPEDTIDLFGGAEEKILAGYRLAHGFYGACIQKVSSKNARCKHTLPMRWDNHELLAQNNDGYIKKNWNASFGGFHCYNIVDMQKYVENGGIDVYADVASYTVDYNSFDEKSLREEINNCLLFDKNVI